MSNNKNLLCELFVHTCVSNESDFKEKSFNGVSADNIVNELSIIGQTLKHRMIKENVAQYVVDDVVDIFGEIADVRISEEIIARGHQEADTVILRVGMASGILSGFTKS